MSETDDTLADWAAAVAALGGTPTHIAIPPERVELAASLGLEIEYVRPNPHCAVCSRRFAPDEPSTPLGIGSRAHLCAACEKRCPPA